MVGLTDRQREKMRAIDPAPSHNMSDGEGCAPASCAAQLSSSSSSSSPRPSARTRTQMRSSFALLLPLVLALVGVGTAVSLLPSALAGPATLPPRAPKAGASAHRADFIPCLRRYSIESDSRAKSGAGAAVSDSLSLSSPQISFITSRTNGTEAYWDEAQSDNLIFHFHPEAITYPRDAAQVAHIVTCARDNGNIAVAARSGGHSFAGYGSGGQDGSVIVDMRHFADIKSSPREGWADVGPGARLGDVVKALWAQEDGKRAMPHGTCPTVGVGGHSLCGGFGPSARLWGLATDSILEADVVLADGSFVTASPTSHPDLFWALRGAGHFFGIVTRFRFRTHDASHPMTFLEYKWVKSIKGPDLLANVVQGLQHWVQASDFPAELGFHLQIGPAMYSERAAGYDPTSTTPQMVVHIRGMYLRPVADYRPVAQKLRDNLRTAGVPDPDSFEEREVTWLELNELWDDFGSRDHKLDTFAERLIHNKFIAKTVVSTDHTKALTRDAFAPTSQLIWDSIEQTAGRPRRWSWNVYMELSGGSNALYRDDANLVAGSSFPHRDSLWLVQASVGTGPRGELEPRAYTLVHDLEDSFHDAVVKSGSRPVGYGCYTDGDKTPGGTWKYDYYGDNIPRLESIKHKLDPTNLFRNPQSLGAASDAVTAVDKLEVEQKAFLSHPLPR